MADFDAIRRGIAACLRDALPAGQGHISAYFKVAPPMPCLQVVGLDEAEYGTLGYGDDSGDSFVFVVEFIVGLASEINAQKVLDRLIAGDDSVKAALKADKRLTKRLEDDGTILTNQAAAAAWARVASYRGQGRVVLPTGQDPVLSASWLIEVAA